MSGHPANRIEWMRYADGRDVLCAHCGEPAPCAVERAHDALDRLSRETGAYEAGYKGWAQQVIREVRGALDGAR